LFHGNPNAILHASAYMISGFVSPCWLPSGKPTAPRKLPRALWNTSTLGFYLASLDAMMHRVLLSRLVEFFLFRTVETKGIYHTQGSCP
jgi:hypothetical protein